MRFEADGLAVEMPENPAPYLTDWLMDVGPTINGPMGQSPVGWSDLTHWQGFLGIELTPWEARTLCTLSRDFLDQMNKSRDLNCPAPFVENPLANDEAVAEQFKRMLRR